MPSLANLPPPPPGKTGWPWNVESKQLTNPITKDKPLPRVSILTPSFNQGNFIEETIRSVLLQGYPNLEYIIVDGRSTDNSVEVIRKYEPWLAYWESEPDIGQANAINKGFRHSTGNIIAWLNSDDCYQAGTIQNVVSYFQRCQDSHVVCGFRRYISDSHIDERRVRVYLSPDRYSLSRCCYLAQETVFFKRSVWETVGELDESYQFALDYDYWQRILYNNYRFFLIPRFLGLFRIHGSSKGNRLPALRSQELAKIYKRYLGTTKNEMELWSEISPKWWNRTATIHWLSKIGLLDYPVIAQRIISIFDLDEFEIPNHSLKTPNFYFE